MNNDYWTNKPQERQRRITYQDIPKLERQFKDGVAFIEDGIEFYLKNWELRDGHGYANYIGVERTRQMTEHKFKVGDWVRRTGGSSVETPSGKHDAGFVGKIASFGYDYGAVVFFENGHEGFLDMYEPWTPRVGERVSVSWTGWDGEGVVTRIQFDRDYIVTMESGKRKGDIGGFPLASLSPATPPATPAASPIRIVTRKEVVPGFYGDVEVASTNADGVSIWLPANSRYTAARLRSMIATLTEIADALDGNS